MNYKKGVCQSYWLFKGVYFPCDLPVNHYGNHINYPKEKGHTAIIIWY
jgi:hypothetical protein